YSSYSHENKISARIRIALKRGVSGGTLKQATGSETTGRFLLADKGEGAENVMPKVAEK
ncbi:hypothetical protein Angca_000426, partial [Angiostrongylus cantonensis]